MSAFRAGFFRGVLVDPEDVESPISASRWDRSLRDRWHVGKCRCGSELRPGAPILGPAPTCLVWYPARCGNGHERLASGGRYH